MKYFPLLASQVAMLVQITEFASILCALIFISICNCFPLFTLHVFVAHGDLGGGGGGGVQVKIK